MLGLGALAYVYIRRRRREQAKFEELDRRVREIATIRGLDGSIDVQAVTKMVLAVHDESEKEFSKSAESMIRQRRSLLIKRDYDAYLLAAQNCSNKQKQIYEEFSTRALDDLELSRSDYDSQLAALPPQTLAAISAVRDAPKAADTMVLPKGLTKEKLKTTFVAIANLHDRAKSRWGALFDKMGVFLAAEGESDDSSRHIKEHSLEGRLMRYVIEDIVQIECGISVEHYHRAVDAFKIKEDPDIVRLKREKTVVWYFIASRNVVA